MIESNDANDELLTLLDRNRDRSVSGEALAATLGITRAAVWKRLERLRALGYEIEGATKRGYRLAPTSDFISESGVRRYLAPSVPLARLVALAETDSTNNVARELAAQGAPEWTVVVANRQRAGRGRFGRSFFSPADSGAYMSVVLRPRSMRSEDGARITTQAALAVCHAIERVSDKRAGIKWVNDVLIDGKKVCGILTEASYGVEIGAIDYAVLGVGINAYPPKDGFPAELASLATSVHARRIGDGRNRLIGEFLTAFSRLYSSPSATWRAEYRARSLALGRRVEVRSLAQPRMARALDVDEECRLVVEYENGERATLSSGEISVRLGDGDD